MNFLYPRARSATIKSRALGALNLPSEARDENVPAKRADFFILYYTFFDSDIHFQRIKFSIFNIKRYSCSHKNDPILAPILVRYMPDSRIFGTMRKFSIPALFHRQIMRKFIILVLFVQISAIC